MRLHTGYKAGEYNEERILKSGIFWHWPEICMRDTYSSGSSSLRRLLAPDSAGENLSYEVRYRVCDFARRILLQKMGTAHSNFLLIRPGATKFSLCSNQESRRLCVDKQLGDRAG